MRYYSVTLGCEYVKIRISTASDRNCSSKKLGCTFICHLLIHEGKLRINKLNDTHSHVAMGTLSRPIFNEKQESEIRTFRRVKGNSLSVAILMNEDVDKKNNEGDNYEITGIR